MSTRKNTAVPEFPKTGRWLRRKGVGTLRRKYASGWGIRDYEHNYNALYEANERGIREATKMLTDTDKVAEWRYKTMSVPGGKGQTYAKWHCTHCKTKRKDRTKFCPECGYRMKNGGHYDA